MIGLVILFLIIFAVAFVYIWMWFFRYTLKVQADATSDKKVAEVQKDKTDSDFETGYNLYLKKEYEQALPFLEKAKASTPDVDKFLDFYILRCQDELCPDSDKCDCPDFLQKYKEMEHSNDLPNEFHGAVAKAYSKAGEISEAEVYCNRALLVDAENAENHKLLGIIQLINKDYEMAKNSLTTSLKLNPNDEEVHEILSYALCYQVDNCPVDRCREKYYELIKKFTK